MGLLFFSVAIALLTVTTMGLLLFKPRVSRLLTIFLPIKMIYLAAGAYLVAGAFQSSMWSFALGSAVALAGFCIFAVLFEQARRSRLL